MNTRDAAGNASFSSPFQTQGSPFAQPAAPPPDHPTSSSGCGGCAIAAVVVGVLGLIVAAGLAIIGLITYRRVQSARMEAEVHVAELMARDAAMEAQMRQQVELQRQQAGLPGMPGGLAPPVAFDQLPEPAPPTAALPPENYAHEELFPLGEWSADSLPQFDERAPEGGVLVGLRLQKGTNWGGAICGVQAIYQVGDAYRLGTPVTAGASVEQVEFLAKPGFAVGAIYCRAGLALNAVRLEFRRVTDRGLDRQDNYHTPWYGCDGGSEKTPIDGEGGFLMGLRGTHQADLRDLGSYRRLGLGMPSEPLPRLVDTQSVDRPVAGNASGKLVKDMAPAGGWLVGLRVFQGSNWGGAIRAVQPIYQVGNEYQLGQRLGLPGGKPFQLIAPAGQAVGQIETDTGLVLDGLRVVWYKVRPDGTLEKSEARASDFIGVRGGQPTTLDSRGLPIGGVFGMFQDDVNQLGIEVVQAASVAP